MSTLQTSVREKQAVPGRETALDSSVQSHPMVLASASALLLWLAFPPADRGYLGWVALVPLFSLVDGDRRVRSLYGGAWLGGLVFGLLAMSWVVPVSAAGMVLMALFLSLWWPLFLVATRIGVGRLHLPLVVVAPVVWVGLEYARANLLTGFAWYYLAHTQYRYVLLIQISDLAGAWGLSFLLAMVNACGADLWRLARGGRFSIMARPVVVRLAVVSGLLLGTLAYGATRLATRSFAPGPRVALMQTDFLQVQGHGPKLDEVFRAIDGLIARALRSEAPPDLLVWPETAYPIGVVRIDPALSEADFASQARRVDPDSSPEDWRRREQRGRSELRSLTDATATPMVVGTPTYEFSRSGLLRHNSAVLFHPRAAEVQSYHKQALVPFGEYVPLVQAAPWLLALAPYEDGYVPSLSPGRGPQVLQSGSYRYAPVICFEDTLPAITRRGFLGTGRAGPPDVLLNLSNEGWFRGSAEHQVHLAISVFRAVECRAPLVRAVNTGISALIDGDGRIRETLEAGAPGVLNVQVPLDSRGSLYLVLGDGLPALCLMATATLVLAGRLRIRHSTFLAQPASVG